MGSAEKQSMYVDDLVFGSTGVAFLKHHVVPLCTVPNFLKLSSFINNPSKILTYDFISSCSAQFRFK